MYVCQVGKMRLYDYGNQFMNELKVQNRFDFIDLTFSVVYFSNCFSVLDGKANEGMAA